MQTRKFCPDCNEDRPVEEFYLNERGFQTYCKKHTTERRRARYAQDAGFREKIRDSNREYHAKHRDAHNEYMREYWRSHLAVYRAYNAKRRARIRGAETEPVDYNAVIERDKGICYLCGEPIEPADLHFDHVIPLSGGGAHSMDNIRCSHSWCNLQKGARVLESIDQ